VASLLLLVALPVFPCLLTARRRPTARPTATPAWTSPAPRQPVRPWIDPDDWWREASALPSRSPRPFVHRTASALEL
jgi:hypothetical protein